ncbi:hypothetical protein ASG52_24485 [Methylobacterium sp. Leaf456]|nr:hypothetical protein ASG52_24485 [Methylobacterium sp. Leaf456]
MPADGIGLEAEGLRIAARAAGIPTDVVLGRRLGRSRPWLRLRVGTRTYCYARGTLRHGSDDPADPLGAHVNGPLARFTADKAAVKERLRAVGIATPEGALFAGDAQEDAIAYALSLGRPVCIKPNGGWAGWYVYPGLTSAPRMVAAFRKARRFKCGVLVEHNVPGDVFRFFYLAPDCVAAKLNRSPSVTGDGRSTLGALIEARNARLRERDTAVFKMVVDGPDLRRALRAQALSLETVPEDGRRITLNHVSNIRRGGETHDGISGTDPSYRAIAETAFRSIEGLKIAALDMMVVDRTQPAAPGNHWVLEINSSPTITDFQFPWTGIAQDVPGMVIGFLQREALRDRDDKPIEGRSTWPG